MKITLFDTSVCTENLGDFIIMDAVRDHIDEMFPQAMVFHTATHEKISRPTFELVKQSNFSFVGGTNLISSNMNEYNQWKINLKDTLGLKEVILMGVGWWQYQKPPNFYTKFLLQSVLNKKVLHSVRDSYAEMMLKKAGIKNVINTSCATMWRLTEEHCAAIPTGKGENVVTTLTDYNKDADNDLGLLNLLSERYQQVHIWPQGSGDVDYIKSLKLPANAVILPPRLDSFNALLKNEQSLDFIGTRLHAGIRSLQNKKRTIIIGIDNRAIEKGKDFNITVCPREKLDDLKKLIDLEFKTEIKLPTENIIKWKNQFH